jgi:acyl dehydratase
MTAAGLAASAAMVSATTFTAWALYVSVVEHPARLDIGGAAGRAQFRPSYRRAAPWQASLAAIAFLSGTTLAALTWRWTWLAGALAIGAAIPLTLVVIMPTNRRRGAASAPSLGPSARHPHRAGRRGTARVSLLAGRARLAHPDALRSIDMAYGRYFEEFTVGQVMKHWPGRTINEADCTWFALLTMNQHPVHSDAHYAATHTQHGQRLVLGPLVFSIGIGMTVADVSGKAIANLEIERIVHQAPTFIGDTLYSESTVTAKRESRQGDRGTVSVETRVSNQRGERVMTFTRTALIPKKNHPTLGEHALETNP